MDSFSWFLPKYYISQYLNTCKTCCSTSSERIKECISLFCYLLYKSFQHFYRFLWSFLWSFQLKLHSKLSVLFSREIKKFYPLWRSFFSKYIQRLTPSSKKSLPISVSLFPVSLSYKFKTMVLKSFGILFHLFSSTRGVGVHVVDWSILVDAVFQVSEKIGKLNWRYERIFYSSTSTDDCRCFIWNIQKDHIKLLCYSLYLLECITYFNIGSYSVFRIKCIYSLCYPLEESFFSSYS